MFFVTKVSEPRMMTSPVMTINTPSVVPEAPTASQRSRSERNRAEHQQRGHDEYGAQQEHLDGQRTAPGVGKLWQEREKKN